MSFFNSKPVLFAGAALAAMLSLGACTTVEGTNAMTDIGTFEREVALSALQGVGMIPKEQKQHIESQRAPLVLPKDPNALPAPREESLVAALPEDSDKVQIDASNLSDEDLRRLRNARVVDLRTLSGRPLTDAEAAQLTANMTAARLKANKAKTPLWVPPDEYFTTVGGQDLVCLAANGDLVQLSDPACPPEIRAALAAQ